MKRTIVLACMVVGLLGGADVARPQAATAPTEGGQLLLDTSGFWRAFFVLRPPVYRDAAGALQTLTTLTGSTPPPPAAWTAADFDDSAWARLPGVLFPAAKGYNTPADLSVAGFAGLENSSSALDTLCLRGKFGVTDPAAVGPLTLSLRYRGGVVAYVNGKEIGRSHIAKDAPAGHVLAEDYPAEAFVQPDGTLAGGQYYEKNLTDPTLPPAWTARVRQAEFAVPAAALRAGVNVVSIAVHRAPYHREIVAEFLERKAGMTYAGYAIWSTAGLLGAQLKAPALTGLKPNMGRPAGLQVWNSQLMQPDYDVDYGDVHEPLRPVRLVGSRGTACSGKVAVGSDTPLVALQAAVSDLAGPAGAKIPATAIQVRYALPTGWEPVPQGRYPIQPVLLDGLRETPPAQIPVYDKHDPVATYIVPQGTPYPAFAVGAVTAVWVTVAVPPEAAPGAYDGKLTISAEGAAPVEVPLTLRVSGWHCPPATQLEPVIDLIQSPESVALQYKVAPYSDEHFTLLEKSYQRLGYVGADTLYLPLICRTNQGNEQSIVRWVREGEGYTFDFAAFDRLLDLAEKHMGKPRVICLYVWDCYIGGDKSRHQNEDMGEVEGPRSIPKDTLAVWVTQRDRATGALSELDVKKYDETTLPHWRKLVEGLTARLATRGLDKNIQLGLASDSRPRKDIVDFWAGLLPNVPWMRQAHQEWEKFGTTGAEVGFQATVVWPKYLKNWQKGEWSLSGWKRPDTRVLYYRTYQPSMAWDTARWLAEVTITGDRRGFGRVGLDFWPLLKDEKGRLVKTLHGRFPESNWWQLDAMIKAFLPPGPDGAMATGKLEVLREGLQEAQARIFIERALGTPEGKEKLPAALVERAKSVLDGRTRAHLPTLEDQVVAGFVDPARLPVQINGGEFGFNFSPWRAGIYRQWYMASGWQERSADLFDVAAEIEAALK